MRKEGAQGVPDGEVVLLGAYVAAAGRFHSPGFLGISALLVDIWGKKSSLVFCSLLLKLPRIM